MLCTHCKKEQATLFYTQNINGKESSAALCPECAKKAGIGNTSILSPLFHTTPQKNATAKDATKKCSLCGLRFEEILSMGKVGCPACYDTFRDELADTIRSIHGGAKHCGMTPERQTEVSVAPQKKEPSEEENLREALSAAIRTENYEEAARLRDAIKALKGENG